ncbi:MAG: YbhB/YbcL family Raf kinase inhibitor-like protein [Ignisphaera sp.]
MRKTVFYITIAIIALIIVTIIAYKYLITPESTSIGISIESVVKSARKSILVTSTSFSNGSVIPQKYTCDGENISPQLTISNIPQEAKSIVLIVYDPDAPSGVFYHWIVYGLNGANIDISEGESKSGSLRQGLNSFGHVGYGGMCPPRGDKPHRYIFLAMALDIDSDWGSGLMPEDVLSRVNGHVIAYGYIVGFYSR